MSAAKLPLKTYPIVALLGALTGGIAAILLTRALPRMLSELMNNTMQRMMEQMGGRGGPAEEICQWMMEKMKEKGLSPMEA